MSIQCAQGCTEGLPCKISVVCTIVAVTAATLRVQSPADAQQSGALKTTPFLNLSAPASPVSRVLGQLRWRNAYLCGLAVGEGAAADEVGDDWDACIAHVDG